MSSSDLRAAGKRWREINTRWPNEDAQQLADFAAAELDDTALTPELVDAIIGPRTFDGTRVARWDCDGQTRPEFRCLKEDGRYILTTYDEAASEFRPKTVGEFRTCLRLAGVPVKGNNNG